MQAKKFLRFAMLFKLIPVKQVTGAELKMDFLNPRFVVLNLLLMASLITTLANLGLHGIEVITEYISKLYVLFHITGSATLMTIPNGFFTVHLYPLIDDNNETPILQMMLNFALTWASLIGMGFQLRDFFQANVWILPFSLFNSFMHSIQLTFNSTILILCMKIAFKMSLICASV